MNRDADNLVDVQWLARCANRLRQEWPRADVTSIEEAALELCLDREISIFFPLASTALIQRGCNPRPLQGLKRPVVGGSHQDRIEGEPAGGSEAPRGWGASPSASEEV